jgi:hypothetical protein
MTEHRDAVRTEVELPGSASVGITNRLLVDRTAAIWRNGEGS